MIDQCLASRPGSLDKIDDTGRESCGILKSARAEETEQRLRVEPTCLLKKIKDSMHGQWDLLARFQNDGVSSYECDRERPHGNHERKVEWNLQWKSQKFADEG